MKKIITIICVFIIVLVILYLGKDFYNLNSDFDNSEIKGSPSIIQQKVEPPKPFSFRGIVVGESLENQLPECKDDWYKKTDPCFKRDSYQPDHYDIQLLQDIGFGTVTDIFTINGNIEKISTYTGERDAIQMLNLLVKKYGKPDIYKTDIVQNSFGAKFSSVFAQWQINNINISLMNRVEKIDDGYLIIESKKWKDKISIDKKQKEDDALKKL